MRKIYILLFTLMLFFAKLFAGETVALANKKPAHLFDAIGPVISYTPLTKSSCLTSRTFTAAITDIDGVNTTVGTRPRVYYKRSSDANTWNSNVSGTNGWKYTEATNTSSPFSFTINYSLLWGGAGVSSGQVLEYFVLAQDLAATPNISINSGSFAVLPSSVALTAAAFPINPAINNYSIVNDLGNYLTIGSFGDFNTLTTGGGLFTAINNVGISQNLTVEILDPLITENNFYPLNQIQNTGCNAGTVSLIIKPAAGVSPIITGSRPNEPIIRILSSNVTIDGSNNGTTSRNLTLRNTNTTSPLVILYGSLGTTPINNSTLKNAICINGANTTSTVIVSDGAVGGSPGYFNNITIQNNSIQKGLIGLQCAAATAAGNGSLLITGNDINSTSPNQIGLLGIYTEGVDGAVISNNNIGNFESTQAGPRYGIQINNSSINSTLSGNNISGISYNGGGAFHTYGIYIAPAVAASNNNITGNIITNITANSSGIAIGIGFPVSPLSASGAVTIQKNNISNIKNTNTSGGAYGIGIFTSLPTSNITVANNFIYDIAAFGSAITTRNGYGIYLGAGGGYKIYYNSVNLNTNQTNTVSGVSSPLIINGATGASSIDMRNNIFANTQTGGTPSAVRYAIFCGSSNNVFSPIDHNDYYSNGSLGYIGATNSITLAEIQSGFGANTNSLNVLPNFVSSTNLHLTTANCGLDGKAIPVSITTDIDAATRDAATPDIGADEFTAVISNTLAGVVATAVCNNKAVSVTGTNYVTAVCDLIARVLPAGGSPVAGQINTCVTRDATQQYFNGEPYVQRHYDIEPASNAATATATVTLYFTNQEFVDYNTINGAIWPMLPTNGAGNTVANRNNVRVTQFHGTPTGGLPTSTPGNYTGTRVLINPGAANVSWNGFYWQVTIPVNGFSGFYVHSTLTNAPLPIIVNYLAGRKQSGYHLLNWKVTCTSTPRATMTLERSADTRNYVAINTITADAVRCQQPFDYTDTDPLKGINYYRLKITDADGKITYSSIVALLNAVKGFDIMSIAPNPVIDNSFKLNVASAQAGKMDMVIFDMQGRLVIRQTISLIAGFNSLPVNVATLSTGTYTIKGNIAGEQTKIMRFVKQ